MKMSCIAPVYKGFLTVFGMVLTFSFVAQSVSQIGGSGTSNNYAPVYPWYGYSMSQTIYTATELSAAGLLPGAAITRLTYEYTGSITNSDEWVIYMINSAKTVYTAYNDWENAGNLVYSGTVVGSNSHVTVILTTPFVWDGISSIVITVDENESNYNSSTDYFYSHSVGDYRTLVYKSDVTNPDPLLPPTGTNASTYVSDLDMTYSNPGTAFVWTGSVGNDWENTSNWSGGTVPTESDFVTIPTGAANYPIISTSILCNELTLEAGAQMIVSDPNATVTVNGSLISDGIIAVDDGKIDISLDATFNRGASITLGEIEVDGASYIGSGYELAIGDGIYDANGSFDASGATVSFTSDGSLYLAGTVTSLGALTSSAGEVYYDGGTQNVLADTYFSLYCDQSGKKTLTGNIVVNSGLTVISPAILNAGTFDINVSGNFTVAKYGFESVTGKVTFDGSTSQTLTHVGAQDISYSPFNDYTLSDDCSNLTDLNTPTDVWQTNSSIFSTGSFSWWSSYSDNCDNITHISSSLDLSSASSATLTFDHIAKLEGGWDKLIIYYSVDGGSSYNAIPASWYDGGDGGDYNSRETSSGYGYFDEDSYASWGTTNTTPVSSWFETESFDLTNLLGQSNVRFAWRVMSDGSVTRYGYLIDNIQINSTFPVSADIDGNFYDLVVNNSAGVVLANIIDIYNSLTFTKGNIVTSSTNILHFNETASAIGASGSSHVVGPVKKSTNSTTEFTFPFGNGSAMRTLTISAETSVASVYTVEFTNTSHSSVDWGLYSNGSPCGTGVHHIANGYWWNIEREAGSADAYLGFNWGSDMLVDVPSDMVATHYNSSIAQWESIGNVIASGSTSSSGRVTSALPVGDFSPFNIGSGSGNNPFPIDLVSFSAECDQDIVDISWTVASQINNDYFIIERSADAVEWETIGYVDGAGNSSQTIDYSYSDLDPYSGTTFYRLTQTDFDDALKVFSSVSVSCDDQSSGLQYALYPNPVANEFTIEFELDNYQGDDVYFTILDANGAIVRQADIELSRGFNVHAISVSDLSSGLYIFRFNNTRDYISEKRIVIK